MDHYAQSREGLLYAADGFSPVRRWDGLTDGWEEAGVPAPDAAPLLTAVFEPAGFLSGVWTGYARYVDRYGNKGNPSPASATLTIADVSGPVEAVSDTTPVRITSRGHGLTAEGRTDVPGTSLGARIALLWPGDDEPTTYWYDVIDADRFDLYADAALTSDVTPDPLRVAGGRWAQNASKLRYTIAPVGSYTNEQSGTVTAVQNSGATLHIPGHGLTAQGNAGYSDGSVLVLVDSFGGGSNATVRLYFTVADADHLTVYLDDALQQPAAGSAETAAIAPGDVWAGYNHVRPTLPAGVVSVDLLRTKDGSGAAAWLDLTVPRLTVAAESDHEDGDLGESLQLVDPFTGDASYALRFGLPPSDKPFLAPVGGRMIAAGDPVEARGAVAVTNGSATVTGVGTAWTGDPAGRLLTVEGADKAYEIESRTGQTLTLTEAYGGPTAPYARYAIGPSYRVRRVVQWSEAGMPEAWYALSTVTLPTDHDGGPVTGLASLDSAAIVFTENRSFRFSFQADPALDGSVVPAADRGCVNDRCWVRAGGLIYALDRRGVYRTDGSGAVSVSDPIGNLFGSGPSDWKAAWRWRDRWHACLDPENETILWFVSLTGGPPRHALAYRLRTAAWEILEYPVEIAASSVSRVGGRLRVLAGSEAGRVLCLDEGARDGASAGTLGGTATSAGPRSLIDVSAAFDASSVNASVRIVAGRGAGQERRIVAASGARLDLDRPWRVRPDGTSRYVVGGVAWRWMSGRYDWPRSDKSQPRNLALLFEPSDVASTLSLRVYENLSAEPIVMGVRQTEYGTSTEKGSAEIAVDVTKANGTARRRFEGTRETQADGWRRVAVGMSGTTEGDRHAVYQLDVEGATNA